MVLFQEPDRTSALNCPPENLILPCYSRTRALIVIPQIEIFIQKRIGSGIGEGADMVNFFIQHC